jgi:hypothetical protein
MRSDEEFALIDAYGRHALMDERGLPRVDYEEIGHLADRLEAYARDGYPPNAFLRAVLENDLFSAVEKADMRNTLILPQLITFVYRELPAACWGSPEKVTAWIQAKQQKSRLTVHNPHDLSRGPATAARRGQTGAVQPIR